MLRRPQEEPELMTRQSELAKKPELLLRRPVKVEVAGFSGHAWMRLEDLLFADNKEEERKAGWGRGGRAGHESCRRGECRLEPRVLDSEGAKALVFARSAL